MSTSPQHRQITRTGAIAGFTLIEFLVVIAIIAILAAILFPVFSRARENARRATCSSNLKQIGLGIMQYSQDFDDRYVPRDNNNCSQNFATLLQPYLKSTQIFSCPSNPKNKPDLSLPTTGPSPVRSDTYVSCSGPDYPPGTGPVIPISYAIHPRMHQSAQNALHMAAVQAPSTKISVAESIVKWNEYGGVNTGNLQNYGFAGHLGTAVYLFGDGHVKALKPVATATPLNMWGARTPTAVAGCTNATLAETINCDIPEPDIIKGMSLLQAKFS